MYKEQGKQFFLYRFLISSFFLLREKESDDLRAILDKEAITKEAFPFFYTSCDRSG